MIFENEILKVMDEKKKYNEQISKYFYKMYCEEYDSFNNKYFNLANRVKDCLNVWVWDAYHENLVLDLQRVNRCKNRFCSNCRKFDLSRALHNLELPFKDLILRGYYPFLLTLTVPNVFGEDLSLTIDRLQKSFNRFYKFFSLENKNAYSSRYLKFDACIRCLEITYNKCTNMYHPHYHCLVFSFNYNPILFDKKYLGEFSNNRQEYNYYSDVDIQIRELWTVSYNNLGVRDIDKLFFETLEKYRFNRENDKDLRKRLLICDIRECDDKGIFEVLKYAIKDSDVVNYSVFKDLYFALYNRRVRQGYGLLYNVKLENESVGKEQDLENYLKFKESPSQLVTTDMKTLYSSVYSNYIKLSRFNKDRFFDKLKEG